MKRKKIILFIVLMAFAILFCAGCATKVMDTNGIERTVTPYGFVEIAYVNGNNKSVICYDPATMICYVSVTEAYRLALSPYYIIGKDGRPEIAVYGSNYP